MEDYEVYRMQSVTKIYILLYNIFSNYLSLIICISKLRARNNVGVDSHINLIIPIYYQLSREQFIRQ